MMIKISLHSITRIAALSLLAVTWLALQGRTAEAEDTAWPSHVSVVEARITRVYFQEISHQKGKALSLPQLRIYDAKGNGLLAFVGYSPQGLDIALPPLLAGHGKADASHPLSLDLARIEGTDGKPLRALPPADLTIVEMWAGWCAPCRAQTRYLAKILGAHPDIRVTLLHVEADPQKM
jgi:thiol-disulfide isomerase/thioredoxin